MTENKNIVIIGCGPGGGTAAQFARKTDRKASITVFEKGKYPQYSKCGLPYTISGKIPEFMDLIEFSEDWFKKANVDLLLETTVEDIDPAKKMVYAKKNDETIEKQYDSLILCTGAKPFLPPIKNLNVDGVFVVRTIDDAKAISTHVKKNGNAVIIGAGLIGLEMADNLYNKGMNITIVESLPNILPNNFDEDMSKLVLENIPEDVKIFTNHIATKIEEENKKINRVLISDNYSGEIRKIYADILIISTGIRPETKLAKEAGCKIGETGGIVVNNKSETSVENIYAVGDCTEYLDIVSKKPAAIGLGSIVIRQAIAAGINAVGGTYILPDGVLQTSTSDFFDMEIASVGPNVQTFKNINFVSGKFKGSSLPDYYPGGKPITIKLFVEGQSGRILAAQAIGDKAAQRINTFACAILGGMEVETLRKLETAYAPPIAPTLDAVTLVCDVVSMKLKRKR